MTIKLFNTLSKKKETFKTIKKNQVKAYVCGPTLNGEPHLGHARQQVSFDILRKYLEFSKYKVTYVSNITDIEDKIINQANKLNITIKELTTKNLKIHKERYKALNIKSPDIQPKATEYVKEMINLVKILEKKGYTYPIENDGVYYDLSKFKDYGKLSKQNIKNLKSGARIKVKEKKRNKEDFVLWKFSKKGEPSWKSPWGDGRPGWHIECSAMSHSILGLPIDIHGGGQDLIFPHHEDEIAQSEAAYGCQFSNYWVHNGMVNVDNVKMGKSLGNFKTISDLLENFDPMVIRFLVISSHYRKPLDFSMKALKSAEASYTRLHNAVLTLKKDTGINKTYLSQFSKEMDDDLNTPKALAVLWELIKNPKAKSKIETIKKIDSVFCLDLLKKIKEDKIPVNIKELAKKRDEARKNKDWNTSDKIRDQLKTKGYIIEDSKTGPRIKKI